jgi:hypothetical protein
MPAKKYLIPFIAISFLIAIAFQGRAQSSVDAFRLAEKWYTEDNMEQAILETKRAIYFNDSIRVPAYLLLSSCFDHSGRSDEAVRYLSMAAELETNDSLKKEIIFQKISMYLQIQKPEYALIELSNLNLLTSVYFKRKNLFYSALAYFQIEDFEISGKNAQLLLETYPGYDSVYLNQLYKRALLNSQKSPFFPAISSAILPGSGQLMDGYYRDAANSFLLNTCIGAITFITFKRLYPFDAILSMYPFVRRYYLSGIFNAKQLVVKKQESVKIEIYNELLDYINQVIYE